MMHGAIEYDDNQPDITAMRNRIRRLESELLAMQRAWGTLHEEVREAALKDLSIEDRHVVRKLNMLYGDWRVKTYDVT